MPNLLAGTGKHVMAREELEEELALGPCRAVQNTGLTVLNCPTIIRTALGLGLGLLLPEEAQEMQRSITLGRPGAEAAVCRGAWARVTMGRL
jgi:hypothetical protein